MYKTLMQLIEIFNNHAKKIGDYEITCKQTGNKKTPYQLLNITEDGLKHKYAGTLKEICLYLIYQTDYEGLLE